MPRPFFFGYGSLVNRNTHDYAEIHTARVLGWQRVWRHTSLRAVAFLSVTPAPGKFIDGVIATVPDGNWQELDRREHAYDRLPLTAEDIRHDHPGPISVYMYRTRPQCDAPPDTRHPILQSYLDTVLLGYLDVFGAAGITHFIETTAGWEAPILQDRNSPIYPRAERPDARTRQRFDDVLDRLGITRIAP